MDKNTVPKMNIPLDKGDVPLNQPFPREVANAPVVDIAEQMGQTAIESALHPTDAAAKIAFAKEEQKASEHTQKSQKNQKPLKKFGSQVKGAALAMVSKKESSKQDSKRKTSDPFIKMLVIIGVIGIIIGIITFFAQSILGIMIMLAGTLVITFAVFAPIHSAKKA